MSRFAASVSDAMFLDASFVFIVLYIHSVLTSPRLLYAVSSKLSPINAFVNTPDEYQILPKSLKINWRLTNIAGEIHIFHINNPASADRSERYYNDLKHYQKHANKYSYHISILNLYLKHVFPIMNMYYRTQDITWACPLHI